MSGCVSSDRRHVQPNIQGYRPQLTSVLSIANRISGRCLGHRRVVLVAWLLAAAERPQAYRREDDGVPPGGSR